MADEEYLKMIFDKLKAIETGVLWIGILLMAILAVLVIGVFRQPITVEIKMGEEWNNFITGFCKVELLCWHGEPNWLG